MPSSRPHSYYDAPPPQLSPTQTALVAFALTVILVVLLRTSLPVLFSTLQGIREMAQFKLSMLAESVGLKGLGGVDWSGVELSRNAEVDSTRSKGLVRSYKDVKPNAAASGNLYPGLLNVSGNLCFLNATLQSMASLPSLIAYLEALPSISSHSFLRPPPTPVARALLATLSALNTPSSRPSPLRPVELASALANSSEQRRRLLASSEQQDAHELWVMLREAVEEEVAKVQAYYTALNAGEGLADVLTLTGKGAGKEEKVAEGDGDEELNWKAPKDPHLLLTSQRVKCMTCGYTRDVRHMSDQQIPLSVPAVAHISLLQLLREHTKPDILSDYACRRCSVQATMDKLVAQRDRLALTSAAPPATSSSSSSPNGNGHAVTRASTSRSITPTRAPPSTSNAFDLPPSPSTPPTMTSSRKQRAKKVQKLVDKLQAVVDANDWEKELGAEFAADAEGKGKGRVERVEGPAAKDVRIARTPEILTIHLSRSTYYTSAGAYKNTCQVAFSEILDLSSFTDHPPPPPSIPTNGAELKAHRDLYRLSSLVVHYGSHSFGHYIAYRRSPAPPPPPSPLDADISPSSRRPEWYRISDETVSPTSLSSVLSGNPVLMFYERWRPAVGEGGWTAAGSFQSVHGGAVAEGAGRGARGVKARVVRRWEVGDRKNDPERRSLEGGGSPREDGAEEKAERQGAVE